MIVPFLTFMSGERVKAGTDLAALKSIGSTPETAVEAADPVSMALR